MSDRTRDARTDRPRDGRTDHPRDPGTDRTRDARIATIVNLLAGAGHQEFQVRRLPALLGVSGATVRRDLAAMERQGMVRRSYGRVAAAHQSAELPVGLRRTQHTEAKRRIGALAASLLPTRPLTIALGGGSTVGFVAGSLVHRADLTVVTNTIGTATALLARQAVKVVMTGGVARPLSDELVGPAAARTLRSHRFDVAVLGVDGVCPVHGLTRHTACGAEIDRVMLERARRRIVVADSSKLGRVRSARIADAGSVDTVVTDAHADRDLVAALRRSGVTTLLVPSRLP
ncbi:MULTISPECIES: DeoR/GlpR family DNA-binding transcription regulator [unclassified Streptomyces]|uniref:DeoR/GlpR family DNA-binding transcription regulator n=1 Tax=unclassified Streptomyces TaxID=2593676 RepID=UPI00380FB8AF